LFLKNEKAEIICEYSRPMLADDDSAVTYCIAHAREWNTRKDNFIISGASAEDIFLCYMDIRRT
jgi:hypothetical protein